MHKKLLAILLAMAMVISSASVVMAGEPSNTEESMGTAESFVEKSISVLRDSLDSDETATVRYYEDMPNVPYMNVTDFYNQFELTGTDMEEGISYDQSDSQYTLTTFNGDKAVFDVDADTIYFDNIDQFVTLAHDLQIENTGGVDEDYPFIKRTNTFTPEAATSITLSLPDYHIDLRGDETGVYAPLQTLADLFATPSNYYVVVTGDKIYIKDAYGILQDNSAIDVDPDYIPAVKADRPDDLAEYLYNELCFDVDLWYGKPGQEFIHDDLLNNKLDDVLTEKYPEIKQMLQANDFASFFTGLNNVYYGVLFDGGHTALMAEDVQNTDLEFATSIVRELMKKDYGASYSYYANDKSEHQAQRLEVRESIYNGDYYIESGDTAMIHFDRFQVDNEGWKAFYAGKGERPLENDSFGSDSFGTVLSGLERASMNPEIKNIIIDISCNGGGDDSALLAIEWLIYGTGYVRDNNRFTNQIQKQSVEVDINFDGKFDEKDVSPYTDYNYGILTSDYSFSCGNAFPWFMHEHGAMILGQQSGGGACALRNCASGGIKARVSSATSTIITEDGGSVDFGCPVDADLMTEGENPYENFYDLSQLSEKMNEYFATTTEETSTVAEAAAASDTDTQWLQEMNRASIANMSIEDGPVYVIGHRSPDSDTVCSAIAYARLLTMLGYPAEAAITEPVNRETEYILKTAGMEAPPVMDDAAGKSIFLIDHSEYAQALEGMEDAHIVGVIDHHGIGGVTTGHQVVYEAKPIGAAATIIFLDYLNYGLEIDKATATLLLGAILSDTANLTTSSVTETDRQAVPKLAEIAEITDVNDFYWNLHSEALSYADMSNEEILFSDYKEYEASGVKFGIGLIQAIDEDHAKAMAERMKEALPDGLKSKQVDLLYADIGIREGDVKVDYIVPCDGQSRDVFEAAFPNCDEYDGTSYIFRNGGLGRKSKFVPGLTEYLNTHPHE